MEDAPTRVVLDLDPSVEPVGGHLSVNGAPARRFVGWMQLADALTTALDRHRTRPADRSLAGDSTRQENPR